MTTGKHLELQPLVYSLAVIKSTIRKIDKYIPDIQDELRKAGYPIDSTVEQTRIEAQPAGMPPKFTTDKIYHSADQTSKWGVGIGVDGLYFHTTDYHNYQDFEERFKKVLDIYSRIAEVGHFHVAAFRQIDNVKVLEEKEETDWPEVVSSDFLPIELQGEPSPTKSVKRIQDRIQISDMELVINSVTFFDGPGPKVPDDLVPLYVALDKGAVERPENNFILADFEAGYRTKGAEVFELDSFMERMSDLHTVAGRGFRVMMKQDAISRREKIND